MNESHRNLVAGNTETKSNFGMNYEPLLDMKTMTRKMAWNIILLFGGGMAIAEGCQVLLQTFFNCRFVKQPSFYLRWLLFASGRERDLGLIIR